MQIDLSNCDREPIHIPGKIQSHGYLLAVDKDTHHIEYCSENIDNLLGFNSLYVLGKSIAQLENLEDATTGLAELQALIFEILEDGFLGVFTSKILVIGEEEYHTILSYSGNNLVIEFEKALEESIDKNNINHIVRNLVNEASFEKVLQEVTSSVKQVIGFDRVMIYQFLEDGTGKVIAEDKNDGVASYMGLHFPESDIPKQARELYVLNKTRLIANVNAVDQVVQSRSKRPLDMSHCKTRAVSPMHIEYLKNMGLCSSFSVSIVVDGKLWGLIACHNYSVKHIDFELRLVAELLGEIISSVINVKSSEEFVEQENKYLKIHQAFLKNLLLDKSVDSILAHSEENLLKVTEADGVAFYFEDRNHHLGKTPPKAFIEGLLQWYFDTHGEELFETNHLAAHYPAAKEHAEFAAGVMIVVLSKKSGDAILWFKPEKKMVIDWAGNQDKHIEQRMKEGELVFEIHPRKSFETYSETVSNRSEAWSTTEIKSAERSKQIILEASLLKSKELKTLNEKLHEAYRDLDTFAYTVSHDLKTPLTVVKANAQMLMRGNLEDPARNKVKSILEGIDDMTYMMDEILKLTRLSNKVLEIQPIDMEELIAKIVYHCSIAMDTAGTKVEVENIIDIQGDATLISQLFQNIIGNALKYSSKEKNPVVKISSFMDNNRVVYKIQDNGIGMPREEIKQIFDLFKRFENAEEFSGSGVGMTIVKNIMDKHNAEVFIDSELNIGTSFFLKFPSEA
ncbi:MAG: ATP-binding protein [Weeksellaceae bacterium]|nr:ATP-binding protein [Weeksellaceae bacterium]